MEDALAHIKRNYPEVADKFSLNPCFNGRCTRTYTMPTSAKPRSLNPCFNGRCTRTKCGNGPSCLR